MPDLRFQVEAAEAVPFASTPTLAFPLRITNSGQEAIHTIALRCQIQVEAVRRRYTEEEQTRLRDLFGEPHRWSQTLRTLLWTHVSAIVPAFEGSTLADLHVPCTFDFDLAIVKYFDALRDGEIPVCFQFSGSVFYAGSAGLQVAPISWDKECRFRLPVRVWQDMMDLYYPNSAWLRLRRDVFDRLQQHKVERGIPTWEETLEGLLEGSSVEVKQ